MRPTLGYDNLAITVWFNQIVKKNVPAKVPVPEDYSIFVSIPSYRDTDLVGTVTFLVRNAARPEKLRIVILNMIQGTKDEYDKKLLKRLYQVIDKEKNKLDPELVPTIEVENVNINYIRNIL